eukprot:CAMPEP_0170586332 /NCGR_PEP_ID=MMETSP0224-20130122/9693_1 /TAXON_ID=285029 /ORGANISM="Togula jolla, Strain CCCM 725" /LENGTH=360 /DNA_ID=CAMNT_0010909881 /DNA_START=201 /DNA_END=1279 /DNA_ORIENTATION=-
MCFGMLRIHFIAVIISADRVRSPLAAGTFPDAMHVRNECPRSSLPFHVHLETTAFIESLQFPQDCRDPSRRFLIVEDYKNAGLGSAMYYFRACFGVALAEHRTLLPHNHTLFRFTKMWSRCTFEDALAVQSINTDYVMKWCNWAFPVVGMEGNVPVTITTGSKQYLWQAPSPLAHLGTFWWLIHGLGFLLQPIGTVQQRFLRRYSQLPHGYAAMHVRRGDKNLEAEPIPAELFIDELEDIVHQDGQIPLRIVTDEEEEVFQESAVAVASPRREARFLPCPSTLKSNISRVWNESDDRDVMLDLLFLENANPLAVALTSNFGFVGMARKIYRDLQMNRPGRVLLVNPCLALALGKVVLDSS